MFLLFYLHDFGITWNARGNKYVFVEKEKKVGYGIEEIDGEGKEF